MTNMNVLDELTRSEDQKCYEYANKNEISIEVYSKVDRV